MQSLLAALALIIAFLIGSIPTALLMGMARGIDVRKHGSGNVGATNAMRVLGKPWGIACLLADMLKGWLPVAFLFPAELFGAPGVGPDAWRWAVALCAIAGHMFSPFLRFRGGKGVATSIGVMLAIAPLPLLIIVLVAVAIIWLTGYVSLASVVGASLLPVLILLLNLTRPPWVTILITALLAAVIVYKHRSNIRRLRQGTEARLFDRIRDVQQGQDPPDS